MDQDSYHIYEDSDYVDYNEIKNDDNQDVNDQNSEESLKLELKTAKLIIESLKKDNYYLSEQILSYKTPPLFSGTVVDIKDDLMKISGEGFGVYYSKIPKNYNFKKGSKVMIDQHKRVVGNSEINDANGAVIKVSGIIGDKISGINGNFESVFENIIEDVEVGDKVILDPTNKVALARIEKRDSGLLYEQVKSHSWDSIGGLEEVIATIREDIEFPFVNKELFEKYNLDPVRGILLYGPPGCGKTLIGKCIASNLSKDKQNYFINIAGPEIFNKWLGESEEKVREIYNEARRLARKNNGSPVIIFIDEAEALLSKRGEGTSHEIYDKIVNQFLTMMDGVNDNKNIITILSTNREEMIDPAILRDGRIDRKIYIPRPNKNGSVKIFDLYLKDKPIDKYYLENRKVSDISREISETIFDDSNIIYKIIDKKNNILGHFRYRDILSGAMIKGIVNRASRYAIKREINTGLAGINKSDLVRSIQDNLNENYNMKQIFDKQDWINTFNGNGQDYFESFLKGDLSLKKYGK